MKKIIAVVLSLMLAMSLSFAMAESTVIAYESRGAQIPATLVTPDGAETDDYRAAYGRKEPSCPEP